VLKVPTIAGLRSRSTIRERPDPRRHPISRWLRPNRRLRRTSLHRRPIRSLRTSRRRRPDRA